MNATHPPARPCGGVGGTGGALVGPAVGPSVGPSVGVSLELGLSVGPPVGPSVGPVDGLTVGLSVGPVGPPVGPSVGEVGPTGTVVGWSGFVLVGQTDGVTMGTVTVIVPLVVVASVALVEIIIGYGVVVVVGSTDDDG